MKKLLSSLAEFLTGSSVSGPVIGIISFIIVALFSLTQVYDLFELKLYDIRFTIKPRTAQWDRLTFLDIDDNSINSIGQFPWPRSVYAAGLEVLKEAGIRQVAFDIQFPDESPAMVDRARAAGLIEKASKGKRLARADIEAAIIDNDAALAKAIAGQAHFVLPYSFQKERFIEKESNAAKRHETAKARELFTARASIPVPADRKSLYAGLVDPDRVAIMYPIAPVVSQTRLFGFVDSDFDPDGISRRIRLVRNFNDRLYFHMSIVMLMDLCGVKMERVEVVPGAHITLKDAVDPVTYKKGDITIPIDRRGMFYINWAGDFKSAFRHVPFYSLIEYGDVRAEIHDFFDTREKESGTSARADLREQLESQRAAFASAADPAAKSAAAEAVRALRAKIRETELALASSVFEEIKATKEKIKGGSTRELAESLAGLENYAKAIRLVIDTEDLQDHVAIAGLTATATQDIGVTPLSSEYLMVGTYHNIINTILQRKFIVRVKDYINYLIMFVIALFIGLVVQRMNARNSLVTIAVSFIVINAANTAAFAISLIWVDQLGTSLALLLPSITITSIKFVKEESQKRFIKLAFSHYLSPSVIENIIKDPDSFKLGGESRTITTFFSDVAKFSTISEKLAPTELVALLNEYLSEMTDILLGYDGTIDKYEGDAIMAFFGAPHFFPDHARRACYTALDMQARLAQMRKKWKEQGRDELYVRIGMNSGEAVVGNMGSRTRMDYTVMGDSVNLASRLEGANKFYGTQIMISEFTRREVGDAVEVRQLDRIRVVGKEEPIIVFELMAKKGELTGQQRDLLDKYNTGLELFQAREWEKAKNSFRAGLRVVPDDGPCKTYVERCTEFAKAPPPKNWDGVYRLKSK